MQSDKLLRIRICVFLLFLCVKLAYSSHASSGFSQYSLIQTAKAPMTTKCMINNCLVCPQGQPYTCSTCKENATCCSHFCKKCTLQKPTQCAECQTGYSYNPQTKNCVLQDPCNQIYCGNCIPDASGNKCQGCMSDSVLIPWTNTCEKCPTGCYQCTVEMECLSCDGHYFNNGTGCEQCDTFCGQCQNRKDYCTSCPVTYYFIPENHTCAKCMDHCINCEKKDQCIKCDSYFFYDTKNQKCQMCGQFCLQCKSVAECIRCDDSHYMNQTNKYCHTCDQVIQNCNQCSKPDTFSIQKKQILSEVNCFECIQGYYLFTNKCLPCISHCIKCQNGLTCIECEMKYVINPVTKMCDKCNIQHCMACQSSTVCQFCQPGYFWNNITIPNGLCFKCKAGCISCGINYCYQCDKGYYLNGYECLKCNSECGSCEKNAANCSICVTGYFLPQNSHICLKCPQHCALCMNENNCQICWIGYRKEGYSCVKCSIQNCGYCSLMDTLKGNQLSIGQAVYGTQVCGQCIPGYYLNSSKGCSPCPEHCTMCENFTLCKSCQKGFFSLNESSLCSPCIEHCNSCHMDNQTWHSDCTECESSFYIDQTNQHCLKCTTANCTKCSQNKCYQCADGFYLKTFGSNCEKCMDNCTQCIDGQKCLACKEGFWWDKNEWKCVSCGEKCKLCVEGGRCIACRDGYRVGNDGKCEQCTLKGCGKCEQSQKQCQECLVGYVMENKANDNDEFDEFEANQTMICFKCGQQSLLGCSECQSSTKCTNCIQGYQLNSNNLCSVEQKAQKVIWPYILTIILLSSILIGLGGIFRNYLGLKLKRKLQGKSLSKLMRLQKDSQDPQNYHKLQDLVIN